MPVDLEEERPRSLGALIGGVIAGILGVLMLVAALGWLISPDCGPGIKPVLKRGYVATPEGAMVPFTVPACPGDTSLTVIPAPPAR
jgi:hypothetical protein